MQSLDNYVNEAKVSDEDKLKAHMHDYLHVSLGKRVAMTIANKVWKMTKAAFAKTGDAKDARAIMKEAAKAEANKIKDRDKANKSDKRTVGKSLSDKPLLGSTTHKGIGNILS